MDAMEPTMPTISRVLLIGAFLAVFGPKPFAVMVSSVAQNRSPNYPALIFGNGDNDNFEYPNGFPALALAQQPRRSHGGSRGPQMPQHGPQEQPQWRNDGAPRSREGGNNLSPNITASGSQLVVSTVP